jgi:transposase
LTSKIHAEVDRNGLPVRLALSACEAHDNRLTGKLLSRLRSGTMLLADHGYDADRIRALAAKRGVWANIPPKCNRNDLICLSPYLYRARNLVERFFNNIQQCRRVATCYDKLAANYLAFIQLAPIRLWLRISESTPQPRSAEATARRVAEKPLGLGLGPTATISPFLSSTMIRPGSQPPIPSFPITYSNDREPNVAELTKRFTLMIIGVGRAGNAWIRRLPHPWIYPKDVLMYLLPPYPVRAGRAPLI